MATPAKERARADLVEQIIAKYDALVTLPYPEARGGRKHVICIHGYKPYLTCHQNSPWQEVIFVSPAVFAAHWAPTLSQEGLRVYRVPTEAEWAELERFKRPLLD